MLKKCITIGTIDKWNIKRLGIFKRLLHTGADRMFIVFSLNDCERQMAAMI